MKRQAQRIEVNIPIQIEVINRPISELAHNSNYEYVVFPSEMSGKKFIGTIRNISINGAMIASETVPPLLSRMYLNFSLPNSVPILAIGLLMWRRTKPSDSLHQASSPAESSFGVLFEAAKIEARQAISHLINRSGMVELSNLSEEEVRSLLEAEIMAFEKGTLR